MDTFSATHLTRKETKMNDLSESAFNDFCDWLNFILKDGNVRRWARYLVDKQDFSASRTIEISRWITRSGNDEIYTFADLDDLDVEF